MAFKGQCMWELVVCLTERPYMVMSLQSKRKNQASSLRFVGEGKRRQNLRRGQKRRSHTDTQTVLYQYLILKIQRKGLKVSLSCVCVCVLIRVDVHSIFLIFVHHYSAAHLLIVFICRKYKVPQTSRVSFLLSLIFYLVLHNLHRFSI